MLKVFNVVLCFLFCISFLYADEYEDSYIDLLQDHEILLNEYDILLIQYEDIINEYEILLNEYEKLHTEFIDLNSIYIQELELNEQAVNALMESNNTIEELTEMIDTRYSAIFLQAGYSGHMISAGVGFTVRFAELPLAFIIDLDYVSNNTIPINLQIGIGYRF